MFNVLCVIKHSNLKHKSLQKATMPKQLNLPSSIVQGIGKGKWVITIQPKTLVSDRLHSSFLNSYAPEDEGLYDDY